MRGDEEYLKKYIFWLGILFHVMKSLSHVLMIIFLDNVYEEADSAEVDIVNSMIEASRVDREKEELLTDLVEFPRSEERANGIEFSTMMVEDKETLESIQLLILEIMSNKLHRLTAWNMFIVQKSVILAFLGSVIPFAIIVVGFFTPDKP